jgi:hypothetical protein
MRVIGNSQYWLAAGVPLAGVGPQYQRPMTPMPVALKIGRQRQVEDGDS